MADLQKPVRKMAVSVSREAWEEFMTRPELRDIMRKFDVGSSTAGKVRVTPKTPEAAQKLDEVMRGTTDFQLVGSPHTPGDDFVPHVSSDVDSSTGRFSGDNTLLHPPALRTGGGPLALKEPRTIDVPARTLDSQVASGGELPLNTVPTAPGFSRKTKILGGVAGAGALGAGAYLASGGEESSEEAGQPGGAVDSSAGARSAEGAEFTPPTPERPKIEPQTISTPKGFDAALRALGPEPKSDEWTPADEQKFNQQTTDLKNIYREAQRRNQWSEVAERVGHALTQFFAARQGMATGTDLSGLKFDKVDWSRRQDQLLDQLKFDVGLVDDARKRRLDRVKSAKDALDRWRSRKSDIELRRTTAEGQAERFNAGQKQSADQFNATIDKTYDLEEERDKKKDAEEAAAATEKAAEEVRREAVRKKKAAQKVASYLAISSDPGSMSNDDVRSALKEFVAADLGTAEDFQKFLEGADTWGPTGDEHFRTEVTKQVMQRAGTGVLMRDPQTGREGVVPPEAVEQAKRDGLVEVQ